MPGAFVRRIRTEKTNALRNVPMRHGFPQQFPAAISRINFPEHVD
jgi:hypothetical protein